MREFPCVLAFTRGCPSLVRGSGLCARVFYRRFFSFDFPPHWEHAQLNYCLHFRHFMGLRRRLHGCSRFRLRVLPRSVLQIA